MFKRVLCLLLLATPLAYASPDTAADAPETFGADMPAGEVTPLDAALASLDGAAAAPRKFSGRIVDVCEKRGCWAMLEADGKAARVMPREHEFMVPRDVRGEAVVYGTLSSVDLSEVSDRYARENPGKDNPVPRQEYRIEALSVVLVEQDG